MITPDKRAQIVSLLRAGHSDARAARDCGVSLGTVRRIRRLDAIPRPPKVIGTPESNRRKGEAILLRKCGFPLKEIGEKMGGITKQRVSQILRGLNVTVTCAKCGKPTRVVHYFHADNGDNGLTKGLCPACVYEMRKTVTTKPTEPKETNV